METLICFCTLSTGSKHKLTQESYNQILEADKDDFITLPNGTTFKNSAVMEIQDIRDWVETKSFNYGQPYQQLPEGNIISKNSLERFLKGYRRVKPNATLEEIKGFMKPKKETKYQTWEEAKLAGVV